MAVTEIPAARIIRSTSTEHLAGHAFVPVGELPRIDISRPGGSGNPALDALRATAWDEGFAEGQAAGIEAGRAAGFERGLVEGRDAGYRDGQVTAHQDAAARAEAQVAGVVGRLEQVVLALDAHERLVIDQVESAVVELALALARAVLDRELAVATEAGRDAMRRALALAPDAETYLVRLNPDDLDELGAVADLAPGRILELVADPAVGPGGCLVEAGAARIDARVESALARIREALLP